MMNGMPRWFDILLSISGLVVTAPLFLIVSIAIVGSSRGSIFYVAKRAGVAGQLFSLYKFRTMIPNAETLGSGITSANDRRVTSIGRILRATKIDELPQLINVCKGDMSFVGPRPEDPRFLQYYPDDLLPILRFKPGITSAASLMYRDESSLLTSDDHEKEYVSHILPAKLRIDLDYCQRASFRSNIDLLFKTIVSVFTKR